jgi:hypothetical protein
MARTSKTNNKEYMSNGVTIQPAIPTVGESITVMYDGLLSKSGASHVYARIGFGSDWDKESDYPMMKTDTGFETTIPVEKSDTLNICFKDCANNWDNNSGMNYSFDVTK